MFERRGYDKENFSNYILNCILTILSTFLFIYFILFAKEQLYFRNIYFKFIKLSKHLVSNI